MQSDQEIAFFRQAAERGKARIYADGMQDGIELTLRLLLGETVEAGGAPCPQPLSSEVERWARDALARLTEGRET